MITMITKELHNIILLIDSKLRDISKDISDKESIYARSIKLNEEVWELMSLVLANYWDQRDEKLLDFSKEKLGHEFADVIITTLLLAKSMDIDINESLVSKLIKIKERWLI